MDQARDHCDLANDDDQKRLYELTDRLLKIPRLSVEEVQAAALNAEAPLEFRVASKLFESRYYLLNNQKECTLGVVFAMWGEQNRLRPKSNSNPNGEDALRKKVAQLEWATQGTSIGWTLYPVDDGCPHHSGKIAQQITQRLPNPERVKVFFLEDAIGKKPGILGDLTSVEQSRKGGAVILGCQQAIHDGVDAVIYTDADCSVHLGQIGLLLQKYLADGAHIILGNRKASGAVLVKEEGRWGIGIKVLRHMQRMVGKEIFSRDILDTQAAFKLYDRDTIARILDTACVVDFSFDTDWILAAIALGEHFESVPFAFIDSFAESASIVQGPMTTWETLLKGLVKSVRTHGIAHNEAMARVIDEEITSSQDLEYLINHLPDELIDASSEQLGDPELMSPQALCTWIQERKSAAQSG